MRFLTTMLTCAVLATSAYASEPKRAPGTEAGAPSARQMALSRRYVELMQSDQLAQTVRLMIGQQAGDLTDGMESEDREFMVELTTELTTEMMPQMLEQLVPVYARTFTETELQALVAFYDSETGRSIIDKTYTSMPEANQAMMSVLPQLMDKMAARICARYGCEPGEVESIMGGASAAPVRTK
jgi:hypothetical protein